MKSNSYNLLSLVLNNFQAWIKSRVIHYKPLEFPLNVGDFEFISVVKKMGPRKSYPLAIYRDKKGQKAFAKMKDARLKGYHYYSLLNEIVMYEALNSAVKRIGNKMPIKFKDIYIPKVLGKYEDNKILLILIEYIDGKVAQDISPEKKTKLYLKVIEYLHLLGNNISQEDKAKISARNSYDYVFLYPFLVIKAIISYPKYTLNILKGVPVFIASVPEIIRNDDMVLTHRDLHFKNTMLSKGNIVLIDLQHCVYTNPIHEITTTVRYWWKRDRLYILLLNAIQNKYSSMNEFERLFKGFIVNSVTHGLTGKGYDKKTIKNWVSFLNYGVNI